MLLHGIVVWSCQHFLASDTASRSIVNHSQVPDEPNIRPRKRCRLDLHIESGPASLPPRYRRQWNKQREHTAIPRHGTRTSSPKPPSPRESTDVRALAGLDTYKGEIYEDSNSESDTESDDSSLKMTPLVSKTTESNVSAAVDLEHLNATARGIVNNVDASKRETNHPPRRRLVLTEGSVRRAVGGVHVVDIPKSAYNTARRVLMSEALELPLVTVSMRADLQFFHQENR